MEQEPYRVEAKVELTKPPEPDAGIDWPAWIQAISPILLALVGLYFTDTVREGFERQQLQLANASGMQGLLVQLLGAKSSNRGARRGGHARLIRAAGGRAAGQRAGRFRRSADAGDRGRPSRDRIEQCRGRLHAIDEYYSAPIWPIFVVDVPVGDPRGRRCSLPGCASVVRVVRQDLAAGSLKTFDPAADDWTPMSPDVAQLLKADVDRALSDAQ